MTRDEAKQFLPIIQAYADGETIQVKGHDGKWFDNDQINFTSKPNTYRIKPKPQVIYVNVYPANTGGYSYDTREMAKRYCTPHGITKKFIEVMDESAE